MNQSLVPSVLYGGAEILALPDQGWVWLVENPHEPIRARCPWMPYVLPLLRNNDVTLEK